MIHYRSNLHRTNRAPATARLAARVLFMSVLIAVPLAMLFAANYEWPTFHNDNERQGTSLSTFTPPLNRQWKATVSSSSQHSAPVLADGRLFSGTDGDGKLRAHNPFTGTLLWERTLGLSGYGHAIPAVMGGVVYTIYVFPSPKVYAIDAVTSDTIWGITDLGGGLFPQLWNTMAASNGRLFVLTTDGRIAALNASNGSVAWTSQIYARSWYGAAVSGGRIIFGTEDARVIALDETNGGELWTRAVDDGVFAVPMVAQGLAFVPSRAGTMYALDAASGAVVWQRGGYGPLFNTTPAYDGTKIYFGASPTAGYHALDAASGADVWSNFSVFPNESSVAYANGHVYGTTVNGTLVTLSAATGAVVDNDALDVTQGSASPAAHNGWIWAQDNQGSVYGYQGQLIDGDGDGDSDGTDCNPFNPNIHHGATEVCNNVDDNCVNGVDEGFPTTDTDNDGIRDCADPNADATGQLTVSGTVTAGDFTQINGSGADDTYEVITEAGSGTKKKLIKIWTMPLHTLGQTYQLWVEAFRNANANDVFNLSWATRASGSCTANEAWSGTVLTISATVDDGFQFADLGIINSPVACVRVQDSLQSGDSQADTLTIDRLHLVLPPPCVDFDGDGYTGSCFACFNAHCPSTLDCDDNDAAESPGNQEGPGGTCNDLKDNDCDTTVDAGDTGCSDALATMDYQVGPGEILAPTNFSFTHSLDGTVREKIRETTQGNKTKLSMIWKFENVAPGASHQLHLQGIRVTTENEKFQFHWALESSPGSGQPGTFTPITGALIQNAFEMLGGSFHNIPNGTGGTWFIKATDTVAGTNPNELHVNYLGIKTVF